MTALSSGVRAKVAPIRIGWVSLVAAQAANSVPAVPLELSVFIPAEIAIANPAMVATKSTK